MDIHKARDVFGLSREVPLNYTIRKSVDDQFISALTRDQHIILFGGSKQGKTSLRKYHLNETDYISIACQSNWDITQLFGAILKKIGFQIERSEKLSTSGTNKFSAEFKAAGSLLVAKGEASLKPEHSRENKREVSRERIDLDLGDANDVVDAIRSVGFNKYIVLEEFHYLSEQTQREFSQKLKIFHENSRLIFIIIGVWKEKNRLIRFNGDLAARVISIDADTWTKEDLVSVINKGSQLLNIEFDHQFIDSLIDCCFQAVYLVQEACFRVCEENQIYQTVSQKLKIGDDKNAETIVKHIIDNQSGRYLEFLKNFSHGFSETKLEMYKWIVVAIMQSSRYDLEKGLKLSHIQKIVKSQHSEKDIQTASFTNALGKVADLQAEKKVNPIIIDYDQTNRKLDVVDTGFLIWHSVAEKNSIVRDILEM